MVFRIFWMMIGPFLSTITIIQQLLLERDVGIYSYFPQANVCVGTVPISFHHLMFLIPFVPEISPKVILIHHSRPRILIPPTGPITERQGERRISSVLIVSRKAAL